jgi:hypothetical protein
MTDHDDAVAVDHDGLAKAEFLDGPRHRFDRNII